MFLRRIAILLSVPLVAGACGGTPKAEKADGPSATAVAVALEDFTVTPETAEAPAGTVTFELTAHSPSAGGHNFVVLKTDLAPDALPTVAAGAADTAAKGIQIVGFTTTFSGSNELSLDVASGHYVLICNILGHYSKGMRAEFTVV
jgi:uncharacterized cupredoxin-like copper-binding protein